MNEEKAHTSCLQRLDALEANVQVQLINHQLLRSRVQMATTKLRTAHVTVSMASLRCARTALATSVYAKMACSIDNTVRATYCIICGCSTEPSVKSFTKFLNTSDMHSASGCASQTLRKPRSRVGRLIRVKFDSIQKKEGVFLL